jgi:hypothetical protein
MGLACGASGRAKAGAVYSVEAGATFTITGFESADHSSLDARPADLSAAFDYAYSHTQTVAISTTGGPASAFAEANTAVLGIGDYVSLNVRISGAASPPPVAVAASSARAVGLVEIRNTGSTPYYIDFRATRDYTLSAGTDDPTTESAYARLAFTQFDNTTTIKAFPGDGTLSLNADPFANYSILVNPGTTSLLFEIGAVGVAAVVAPEPSTLSLAGTAGVMGLGYWWRRRAA